MSKQTDNKQLQMNRRRFLGMAGGALAGAQALSLDVAAETARSSAGADSRPNFLFMIADDLMFRTIHSINNPEVHTPNIDRLVQGGCHFTHCFHQGSWTGAVCIASRTMLLTGLTAFNANHAIPGDQSAQIPVWGQTLREHGYKTYITGKWHLDAVSLSRSFAEQGPVGPGFFDSTRDMYNRPAPGDHWNPTNHDLKGHWLDLGLWDRGAQGETRHSSEVYADSVIEYLDRQKTSSEPFFVYLGFNAPHDPRQAPQEFLDMYPIDSIQVPPNFLPEHPFDQGAQKVRDELLAPFPRTEFDIKTHRREYYAIISHMDAQIGRILDALEKSGKAANTYVILTADHGLAVGEHGLMGKQNQYECSMRMPLIMRGPHIQPGKCVDEMVYQHSMFATTCDLAGAPIPKHVEFPSLVQMLREEQPKPIHDAMFGWLSNLQRSVRTKKHKLIYYAHLNRYQLFDLEKDPWEMNDLVNDPAYGQVKTELIARLRNLQRELGDTLELGGSGNERK
jgi:choline-sulfatase